MARGTDRIANCIIIMKKRMSIAYSTSAEIEPICIAWAPTRSAPSHTTTTSAMFMTKKVRESVTENT